MSYNSKYKGAEVDAALDLANSALQEHQDISGLATKTELDGKVDKVDGKRLSTEDFTTLLKEKLEGLSNYDDTAIQESVSKLRTDLDTLVSGDTTTAIKTFNEVIAFLDGIEDSESLDSIIASIEQQIAAKGTYTKPSTGIPKSDLDSAVQTSLGKADTALQSYTEQYKGTVTGVKLNGTTKAPDTNGVVDLGTIEEGGSGDYLPLTGGTINGDLTINGRISANRTTTNTLVFGSGSSLKVNDDGSISTGDLNNDSALDILINGDGTKFLADDGTYKAIETSGSSSGGGCAYPEEYLGTTGGAWGIKPNVFYIWDEVDYLDLSFEDAIDGYTNEYLFQFSTGNTDEFDIQITLPDYVKWANDTPLSLSSYKTYQVCVLNGLAAVLEFNRSILINFTIDTVEYQCEPNMTWDKWIISEYNTGSFTYDSNGFVMTIEYMYVVDPDKGTPAVVGEIISPNKVYILSE